MNHSAAQHHAHLVFAKLDQGSMQPAFGSPARFITFIRQDSPAIIPMFLLQSLRVHHHATKVALRQSLHALSLFCRVRPALQDIRKCGEKVHLWGHERNFPLAKFGNGILGMKKGCRNDFLPAVYSRNKRERERVNIKILKRRRAAENLPGLGMCSSLEPKANPVEGAVGRNTTKNWVWNRLTTNQNHYRSSPEVRLNSRDLRG